MNNKSLQMVKSLRKQYVEACDDHFFNIKSQQIKIPFINYNERKLPQKSALLSIQQPPQYQELKMKKNELLSRLRNKKLSNVEYVIVNGKYYVRQKKQNQQFGYFYKSNSITSNIRKQMNKSSKSKNKPINIQESFKSGKANETKEQHLFSEQDSYFLFPKSPKSAKNQIYLPDLRLKQLEQKSPVKSQKKRKKQILLNEKNKQGQLLKKCYTNDTPKLNEGMLSRGSKTVQEMENQFILRRIMLAKPSYDLERMRLNDRYEKIKQYQQMREKKSRIFSPKSFLLSRSTALKPSYKYIKL